MKVLVIGYGNPGRRDDGLGPTFAARLQELNLEDVTVDSDYQLNVEDAHDVAAHDAVVFVDAWMEGNVPFQLTRIEPKPAIAFSSHSVEPPALLALAHDLFGSKAPGYALAIRGYEFGEFGEGLSMPAAMNLEAALAWFLPVLRSRDFDAALGS